MKSIFALAFICTIAACAPSSAVAAPTENLAVCILTTLVPDVLAGDPWGQCVSDTIAKCGTDVATITQVWDAHVAAEVAEGKMPPVINPGSPDGGK